MRKRKRFNAKALCERTNKFATVHLKEKQGAEGFVKLIVFSGLPGTGKTTLAETIGREMGIPVFAKDWLMGVIEPFEIGLAPEDAAQMGYGLLTMLARRQLMLGQSAILDSVLGLVEGRQQWQALAAEYGAGFYAIETICSDTELHRARLEGRQRGIPGWHELVWAEVERTRSYFQAWTGERLVVDAVAPLESNLERVRTYVHESGGGNAVRISLA